MKDYNAELQAMAERVARLAKVRAMLSETQAQRARLVETERQLAMAARKEQADVDRLEHGSLTAFVVAAFGNMEQRLEKEQAEAYAAAVKHDAAAAQLRGIEQELDALQREQAGLAGCEAQYQTLLAEKAEYIKASDPANGAQLCAIEKKIADAEAQGKELREALAAGDEVLYRVDGILQSLSNAEGWSTWDLLGGGLISDLAKHSELENAQHQVDDLQGALRRYATEMADVSLQAELRVQIDGFLQFADFFFDGLFADWAVRDQIHSSQQQVEDTRCHVMELQSGLSRRAEDNARQIAALQAERETLLTAV